MSFFDRLETSSSVPLHNVSTDGQASGRDLVGGGPLRWPLAPLVLEIKFRSEVALADVLMVFGSEGSVYVWNLFGPGLDRCRCRERGKEEFHAEDLMLGGQTIEFLTP